MLYKKPRKNNRLQYIPEGMGIKGEAVNYIVTAVDELAPNIATIKNLTTGHTTQFIYYFPNEGEYNNRFTLTQ